MKRILVLIFLTFFIVSIFAIIEETASLQAFLIGETDNCSYDNWQSHVVEGIASANYNLYAPYDVQKTDFGSYQIPSEEDLEYWQTVINSFVIGDLASAETLIDSLGFPYQVVIFHDTDMDRTYNMLREIPNFEFTDDNNTPDETYDDENGAFENGWGLFIAYPEAEKPIIITAPHPTDDYITPVISMKAFQILGAKYLLVSGVGREVVWTHVDGYTNSKSLCDPSRNTEHTFNTAYRSFADEIRETFQHREFSMQIHSYDWGTRHPGYANLQVSAGYAAQSPDLPIRDHSSLKSDLSNSGDRIVFHPNEVGMNPEVDINSYAAYHCKEYDFEYVDEDTTFAINTSIDLTGYSQNKQGTYTFSGWNQYDVFDPFFHIEMDELPNQYLQTDYNYKWFNGWDELNQVWDMNAKFDKTIEYYSEWIYRLIDPIDNMFEMNDNLVPGTPQNFSVLGEDYSSVVLTWDKVDSYDFDSYEIFYSTEPITDDNYQIHDRANFSKLACSSQTDCTLNLAANTEYFFKIRARDKNGNFSDLSEQISTVTSPININNFAFTADVQSIHLFWNTSTTTAGTGINIYRKTDDEDYILVDGWQANAYLQCDSHPENFNYQYTDSQLENDVEYTYKLCVETAEMDEFTYHQVLTASSMNKYKLTTTLGTDVRNIIFGRNADATNGYNSEYDIEYDEDLFFNMYFSHENWDDNNSNIPTKFKEEILGYFDESNSLRSIDFVVYSTQLDQEIEISLSSLSRNNERIYVSIGNEFVNMQEENLIFTPTENTTNLKLYWGNMLPNINIIQPNKKIFTPNEIASFNWSTQYSDLIDSIDLFLRNDEITIPIAYNLANTQSQFNWIVPEITKENLEILVKCNMREGDVVEYISNYKIGVVPNEIFITAESGWQLIGHPFEDEGMIVEDMYSPSAEFYRLTMGMFFQDTNLNSLRGYWLYSDEDIYTVLDSPTIYQTTQSIPLNLGWNIIANPHPISYDFNQLKFEYNSQIYDMYAALQEDMIRPILFKNETGFERTEILEKQKSYYFYTPLQGLSVIFDPFYRSGNPVNISAEWMFTVKAEQEDFDSGQIVVGSADNTTNGYDFLYDFTVPMLKPFDNQLNMGLISDNFPGEKVYSDFIESVNDTTDVNLEWNAIIEVDSLAPIKFSALKYNIPNNVNCYLIFDDTNMDLTSGVDKFYVPSTNVINFTVRLTSEFLDNYEDVEQAQKISLMNYPNPFNPKSTIKFSIPQKGMVELNIYNIKGQLVKTMINESLDAGIHKLDWNGIDNTNKSVVSGVYFYKLNFDDEKILTKKMLLLK